MLVLMSTCMYMYACAYIYMYTHTLSICIISMKFLSFNAYEVMDDKYDTYTMHISINAPYLKQWMTCMMHLSDDV